MDLSASSREDPFSPESIFSKQDLPVVPNDNPESYCRLCLTTPDVEPLFPMAGEPNVYAMELIGKYIGIGLTLQDDFPCAVCRPCQLILDQFDLFRQNCLKVDIAIRRRRLGLDRVVKAEPYDEHSSDEGEEEFPYIRLDNKQYQCRVCSEAFRTLNLFMSHCREVHPEESKMFKCKYCNKSFMTKTARLQHIRSHLPNSSMESDIIGDRVQVCEKCMVTFDSYKLLKNHIKEDHSDDPKVLLVCKSCNKHFSRITILRNHILRVHLGRLPHVCKHCGVSYGYTRQLVSHLKHEHGIIMPEPEMQDQSGQSIVEEDADQDEENVVIPPSPAPPQEEPQILQPPPPPPPPQPQPQQKEPPPESKRRKNKYTCAECGVQCSSTDDLRAHRKLHQDPTWWKCMHCRNFVKHQKMHLMKKHPAIGEDDVDASFQLRFRCWMCRVYFKTLSQVEQHAFDRHQIPLPPGHQKPAVMEPPEVDHRHQKQHQQSLVQMMEPPQIPMTVQPLTPITEQPQRPITVQPQMPITVPQMPMTVQPPLPIAPEHLPLLLSHLENGAWDYLREINRFMDPNNIAAFTMKIKDDPDRMDTSASAVDLSGVSEGGASSRNVSVYDAAIKDDLDQDDDAENNDSQDDAFIRLDNRVYQCRYCSETFRHLLLIRKHTKEKHPTEWKSFKCSHCKRRFPSAAVRDRHAHFHSLDHPFKCAHCNQMYNSKKRLDQHFASYHDVHSLSYTLERLRCGACSLTFAEKKYYDLHCRIYHQHKPHRTKNLSDKIQVCERCITTFQSRELLMEHIRQIHKSDPPLQKYECPRCSKDLKTVTLLRIHILVVHLGHLPFVCQYCNIGFPSRHWLLKHHETDHTELAIHKCPSCDETFNDELKLTQHQDQAHAPPAVEVDPGTGMEVFPCIKCDKKLESKDHLEKHVIKAHPTFMLMYKCPLCNKPIRYRKQHMRVHHDIEYEPKEHNYQTRYKCHCCSKLFKNKRNLLSHQNVLSFQCERCQMRFKTKRNLQDHSVIHRPGHKSLKCDECGLEFGYRARLEEHKRRFHSTTSTEKLKLISCPFCPKLFMTSSNRERHISTVHPQYEFQVKCGHCDLEETESVALRKHYREEHPKERVTYKCIRCDKIYLNLSSFKVHCKQHTENEGPFKKGESKNNNPGKANGVEIGEKSGGETSEQTGETQQIKEVAVKTEATDGEVTAAVEGSTAEKVIEKVANDKEPVTVEDGAVDMEALIDGIAAGKDKKGINEVSTVKVVYKQETEITVENTKLIEDTVLTEEPKGESSIKNDKESIPKKEEMVENDTAAFDNKPTKGEEQLDVKVEPEQKEETPVDDKKAEEDKTAAESTGGTTEAVAENLDTAAETSNAEAAAKTDTAIAEPQRVDSPAEKDVTESNPVDNIKEEAAPVELAKIKKSEAIDEVETISKEPVAAEPSAEERAATSVDGTAATSVEDPANKSSEEPAEKPAEGTAATSVEGTAATSAEGTAATSVEGTAATSGEDHANKSSEEPPATSAEGTAATSAKEPPETSTEDPAEKSSEEQPAAFAEALPEASAEAPAETPAKEPAETSAKDPAERSAVESAPIEKVEESRMEVEVSAEQKVDVPTAKSAEESNSAKNGEEKCKDVEPSTDAGQEEAKAEGTSVDLKLALSPKEGADETKATEPEEDDEETPTKRRKRNPVADTPADS